MNGYTHDGVVVEFGGQWVGPTQDRALALAAALDAPLFPTYNDGQNLVSYRGRHRRYRGAIPKLPPRVLASIGQAQLRLDRMARRVPLDEPWTAADADEWDGQTVESWLRRHVGTGAHARYRASPSAPSSRPRPPTCPCSTSCSTATRVGCSTGS